VTAKLHPGRAGGVAWRGWRRYTGLQLMTGFPAMPKCKWRLDRGQIEVVDEDVAEVLRRKTPAQRLAMAFAADRTIRQVIAGAIRGRHPDWDESQVREEVARRMTRGAT
jgi:hypothetical protein